MPRMKSLHINRLPASIVAVLFDHPAPCLRVLGLRSTDEEWSIPPDGESALQLPSCWAGGTSPPLQSMVLGRVAFPVDMQPLLSLRSLTCEPIQDARRLFQLCPNADHVVLCDVQAWCMLPAYLPLTLETFTLSAPNWGTHDHFGLVLPWMGQRVKNLTFVSVSLVPVVGYFLATCPSGWDLRLEGQHWNKVSVTLKADNSCSLTAMIGRQLVVATPLHDLSPHLLSLTSLSLQFNPDFVPLWGTAAGFALPSLIDLTFIFDSKTFDVLRIGSGMLTRVTHPIVAPGLRNLNLLCPPYPAPPHNSAWPADVIQVVKKLRHFVTLSDPLERISVVIPNASLQSFEDCCSMRRCSAFATSAPGRNFRRGGNNVY